MTLHRHLIKAHRLESGRARADTADGKTPHTVDNTANSGKIVRILAEGIRQGMHNMGLHHRVGNAVLFKHIGHREFSLSRTRLYELAASAYHCPIAEHIRTLRIEKARELLCDTDKKISDIAMLCGFSDYVYFTKLFKRLNGSMTPRAYRKAQAPASPRFPASPPETPAETE